MQIPVTSSKFSYIDFDRLFIFSNNLVAFITIVTRSLPVETELLITMWRKSPVCFFSLYPEMLSSSALHLTKSIILSQISGCIGQYFILTISCD